MASVEIIAGFGGALTPVVGVLALLVAVDAAAAGGLVLMPNWALLPITPLLPGLAIWGKGLFHSFLGFFFFGSLLASFFPPGFSPLMP